MGNRKKIGAVIAFIFVLFQLGSVSLFSLNELTVRSIHVMLAVSLALIITPWSKKGKDDNKVPFYDWVLVAVAAVASINILLKNMVIYEMSAPMGTVDMILGICLFLIVIDSARRTSGWPVVVLTGIALALVYLGPILPDVLRTRGLPLSFIIKNMYFSTSGLYGSTTGLSATVLAIFLIFGGILVATGVGDIFVNSALRVAGRARGGPAKVAIVASALMGMISGSSMAICAVTGTYTIPMMKKLGYKPEFAGAVEASSSTGGTFTPPVMALGAFLMAEMLGINYATICYHAAFLAALYYLSIYIGVDYEAKYLGLAAMKGEDMPPWSSVWGKGKLIVLAIPIIFLFYLILKGVDLTIAGFWTCIITLVLFLMIGKYSPAALKDRTAAMVDSFVKGGESLAGLAPLVITASVLVNILFVGGLTARLIEVTEAALAQNMWGGLALGAIVPLILGMAVPPIAAYILSAAMLAPGLSHFFPPLMVHLFLFFYSCLAQITPPVCGAVFVGAAIAEANWVRTAFISLKLAAVGFIFPFFFMLSPAMVGYHSTVGETVLFYGASVLGVIAMSLSFFGFREKTLLNIFSRAAFLASALLLLYPSNYLSLWGLGIGIFVLVLRVLFRRRTAQA
ncbi:MAG TPA: TRAP transporter fused permease subunit [Syntrophorhabdaceae bacterium]|nr:TRAP transporter fused permease subunit [Syntrophorhabdaceae bacterium]